MAKDKVSDNVPMVESSDKLDDGSQQQIVVPKLRKFHFNQVVPKKILKVVKKPEPSSDDDTSEEETTLKKRVIIPAKKASLQKKAKKQESSDNSDDGSEEPVPDKKVKTETVARKVSNTKKTASVKKAEISEESAMEEEAPKKQNEVRVKGLPKTATEDDIKTFFGKLVGEVASICLLKEKNKFKGTCFVRFVDESSVQKA